MDELSTKAQTVELFLLSDMSVHTAAATPRAETAPATTPTPSRFTAVLPGLALSAGIALSAMALARVPWLAQHGFSALTVAIVLGMVIGNVLPGRIGFAHSGITFSKGTLLRAGIILYGLRLTVHDIAQLGLVGVAVDVMVMASTFALACWIGGRWLGMDRRTAMLVGAGSSICGAAAVIATEPVVRARAEEVTVAVATVVVFGTVSMFLYPFLFDLNQLWPVIPGGARAFGLYVGSTVHEVAQVVAASGAISNATADTAVIAKMFRVLMLAPFLLALSAWLPEEKTGAATAAAGRRRRIVVPWFAVGFLALVLINSAVSFPSGLVHAALELDTVLLSTAMAALGLTTRIDAVRQAGVKPLVLALALFGWLVVAGALMNRWAAALLG